MKGELRGPSPHDGKEIDLPADTVAVVLITTEPGGGYRAQYAEVIGEPVDRRGVAWSLARLAEHESMGGGQ